MTQKPSGCFHLELWSKYHSGILVFLNFLLRMSTAWWGGARLQKPKLRGFFMAECDSSPNIAYKISGAAHRHQLRIAKANSGNIELGLVKPNASIAQLHIKLLKGTPPVIKLLNSLDAWVTALCKKLVMWWPWVRQAFLLDTPPLWYDGNTVFGYQLYREINRTESQTKAKGKACSKVPTFCSHWETLAVDLDEFRGVADELLASKIASEVFIGQTIDSDAIPDVKKFQQKKERALKQKKKQEMMILNGLRSFSGAGVTRSCRIRRPISYTFGNCSLVELTLIPVEV
ncbi:hypothetical protein COLO4_18717 [Corchorus olitorius]|uniref:Uncharacterized protein n=1 Tax=Corchorus olitorius TaxID=93759 RepID=A0A1R3J891_9ROSI|nr:hypothetical protein COLO4_18717 [Corchorus olitorius]